MPLLTLESVSGRTEAPCRGALQAALPREMYVDEQTWLAERETVLFGQWFCVGRIDELGLAASSRVVVVDVAGESVLVTSDEDRRLHGAYNVCRHRGSQIMPVLRGADARRLRGVGAALSLPLVDLRARRPADACPAHRPRGSRHRQLPAQPGRGGDLGRVRVRPSLAGAAQRRSETRSSRAGSALANYGLDGLVTGATMTYEVDANYKVLLENYNECYHCGPVHPELCRLVPAFAGGGADLDWEDGVPHRDGAWTFTMSGTTSRAPLPGLSEEERTRHKGDLVFPNLLLSASADHVAAFVLLPRAVDRTDVVCSLLFARRRGVRDSSTPATRASSGTWSTGRTGQSASRCSVACRPAAIGTAGSRRWRTTASTSAAGCCRC